MYGIYTNTMSHVKIILYRMSYETWRGVIHRAANPPPMSYVIPLIDAVCPYAVCHYAILSDTETSDTGPKERQRGAPLLGCCWSGCCEVRCHMALVGGGD
jgi:hypothetical protein